MVSLLFSMPVAVRLLVALQGAHFAFADGMKRIGKYILPLLMNKTQYQTIPPPPSLLRHHQSRLYLLAPLVIALQTAKFS